MQIACRFLYLIFRYVSAKAGHRYRRGNRRHRHSGKRHVRSIPYRTASSCSGTGLVPAWTFWSSRYWTIRVTDSPAFRQWKMLYDGGKGYTLLVITAVITLLTHCRQCKGIHPHIHTSGDEIRDTPCTSTLHAVERDTPCTSTLLSVGRDTSSRPHCTWCRLIHPCIHTAYKWCRWIRTLQVRTAGGRKDTPSRPQRWLWKSLWLASLQVVPPNRAPVASPLGPTWHQGTGLGGHRKGYPPSLTWLFSSSFITEEVSPAVVPNAI